MKPIPSILFCLCVCACLAVASFPAAAAEEGGTNAPAANAKSQVAGLHQQRLELAAQFSLLKELALQHRQRADEADRANQPEKVKWETDLVRELSERVDRTAAQLDEATRQGLAVETSVRPPGETKATDPEEVAYLTRLDTELWRVEQDLKAVLESTRSFSASLATNHVAEEMLRVSFLVQENNTLQRFLERQRSDLELSRLQYQALKQRREQKP